MAERRSRTTKGIVVFIDSNSQRSEQIAEGLEAHGYHVLTVQHLQEGMELVRMRRPDAVVAIEPPADDSGRALPETATRHLAADVPMILICTRLLSTDPGR